MKKVISVALSVMLLFLMVSCGGSKVDGMYYNETSGQTIELEDSIVTWTEFGATFKGTYEVKGKNITLTVNGGALANDTVFTGTIGGNTILLTGGSLSPEGENFVKQ